MKDPSVDFYKPFQSGEGTCYPIYPWNYYNVPYTKMFNNDQIPQGVPGPIPTEGGNQMYGGKKKRKSTSTKKKTTKKGGSCCNKSVSFSNGVSMDKPVGLDMKNNFGPFLFPPTEMPMNPQCGGKKKSKKMSGGQNLVGPTFATQPLVPTNPSTPADYVGYNISDMQKMALTGSGVPGPTYPMTEKFLNNNMGITYATQAGGKKNKKGGTVIPPEYYDEKLKGSFTTQDVNSNAGKCGGSRKGKRKMKAGGVDDDNWKMEQGMGRMTGSLGKANSTTGGGIMYRGAPGPMAPSNMSKGDVYHPEWSYDKKGGKRGRKLKGGADDIVSSEDMILTPDAIFSPDPAGVQVQQGLQTHTMKAPKDFGGITVGNDQNPAIQAQMVSTGEAPAAADMAGGKKSKSTSKKSTTKKPSQKKKTVRKHKGGDDGGVGSDFATTLASRGPVNYPDGPTADRFRFFTKTANFIPNSMLKYAAAPVSTGYQPDPNPYPLGYNSYLYGGAKKKSKSKKSDTKKKSKK